MKIIIIEDEKPAREKLKRLIEQYDATISVVAELASVAQSIEWLNIHPLPELILADIELLDGNVFNVFQEVPHLTCPIIFTTSYEEFWMKAFQTNGIEYLLKPFSYDRLAEALNKFRQLKHNFASDQSKMLEQIHAQLLHSPKHYKQRFMIKTREGFYLLELAQVMYLKAEQGVIFAYSKDKKRHLLPINTLLEIEGKLDPSLFYRINRAEIVHIQFIERLEQYTKDRMAIILKYNQGHLISSQSRTTGLKQWLANA